MWYKFLLLQYKEAKSMCIGEEECEKPPRFRKITTTMPHALVRLLDGDAKARKTSRASCIRRACQGQFYEDANRRAQETNTATAETTDALCGHSTKETQSTMKPELNSQTPDLLSLLGDSLREDARIIKARVAVVDETVRKEAADACLAGNFDRVPEIVKALPVRIRELSQAMQAITGMERAVVEMQTVWGRTLTLQQTAPAPAPDVPAPVEVPEEEAPFRGPEGAGIDPAPAGETDVPVQQPVKDRVETRGRPAAFDTADTDLHAMAVLMRLGGQGKPSAIFAEMQAQGVPMAAWIAERSQERMNTVGKRLRNRGYLGKAPAGTWTLTGKGWEYAKACAPAHGWRFVGGKFVYAGKEAGE